MLKFIKRKVLKDLQNHLGRKEITLIVGSRQVGKTTLMRMLQNELSQTGEKTLFLGLDFDGDKPFFESQAALIQRIELEMGKKRGFVFIDEIQRKENAGLFLKGLYDLDLPYKFIVSGSGSLELKEKIHESLAGRKRIFEVMPVSFEEFVNFKTEYKYEKKIKNFFKIEIKKVQQSLEEYLNFGGYPRVILEETLDEKLKMINEIFQSYLEKDISSLLRIDKPEVFSSLIKMLASQIGYLVNYSEISNTLGLSIPTVKKYLWYAEKTFTIETVTPFFKNVRKEITKSPVIYFNDLGLRSFALGLFGHLFSQKERSFSFQNLIFMMLKERLRNTGAKLHFWRTKDGAEIDFVIQKGKEIIPIEVKYTDQKPYVDRSMKSFIEKHNPSFFLVVTKAMKAKQKVDKTELIFLPFWEVPYFDF